MYIYTFTACILHMCVYHVCTLIINKIYYWIAFYVKRENGPDILIHV